MVLQAPDLLALTVLNRVTLYPSLESFASSWLTGWTVLSPKRFKGWDVFKCNPALNFPEALSLTLPLCSLVFTMLIVHWCPLRCSQNGFNQMKQIWTLLFGDLLKWCLPLDIHTPLSFTTCEIPTNNQEVSLMSVEMSAGSYLCKDSVVDLPEKLSCLLTSAVLGALVGRWSSQVCGRLRTVPVESLTTAIITYCLLLNHL